MIVTDASIQKILEELSHEEVLSCDTETTGLRPYHGDRLFSIIIGKKNVGYYFNFQDYEDDKRRRLGVGAEIPHRIKYKKFTR